MCISVDPSLLENALLNLAINARDAMPDGGSITINASHFYQSEDDADSLMLPTGNYIKISVTDTGTGISDEDLPRVFDPFFTTKDVGKGSGLGLSMVYGFVQQSGGTCQVTTKPGKGTTISLYFPKVQGKENSGQLAADKEMEAVGQALTILVVEDEHRVRRVTLRDLQQMGYNTLEAENADGAKAIIESGESINLLFSDVLMPGNMDGHMLAIWTKENHPDIRIVLTSGYSKGKADVGAGEAHSFPMVRKPYTIRKLAETINAELGIEMKLPVD
ncbi:MAG: response regulator [Gammaproteobacteria bacterium]|jgi:CheY-like chemotaxis protein|nr:response regulator [Gammaproteobacteria bacterium]